MLFVFAGLEAFAQDMIIYKDKTIDEVTIVEVTPDYVKYREYGAPINSVTFSIEKDYLSKLIFESNKIHLALEMFDNEICREVLLQLASESPVNFKKGI